jgi:hypothetical protein
MDLNEGQKSLGRTVVTAEEGEKVAQAVDSTAAVLSSRCEAIRCEGRVFFVAGTLS